MKMKPGRGGRTGGSCRRLRRGLWRADDLNLFLSVSHVHTPGLAHSAPLRVTDLLCFFPLSVRVRRVGRSWFFPCLVYISLRDERPHQKRDLNKQNKRYLIERHPTSKAQFYIDVLPELPLSRFETHFRMSPEIMTLLVGSIEHHEVFHNRSRKSHGSVALQTAVAVR